MGELVLLRRGAQRDARRSGSRWPGCAGLTARGQRRAVTSNASSSRAARSIPDVQARDDGGWRGPPPGRLRDAHEAVRGAHRGSRRSAGGRGDPASRRARASCRRAAVSHRFCSTRGRARPGRAWRVGPPPGAGGSGRRGRPSRAARHGPARRIFDRPARGRGVSSWSTSPGRWRSTGPSSRRCSPPPRGARPRVLPSLRGRQACRTPGSSRTGDARRRVVPPGNVGNGVDGPALRFALSSRRGREPVIWVCDGQVTDSERPRRRWLSPRSAPGWSSGTGSDGARPCREALRLLRARGPGRVRRGPGPWPGGCRRHSRIVELRSDG